MCINVIILETIKTVNGALEKVPGPSIRNQSTVGPFDDHRGTRWTQIQ